MSEDIKIISNQILPILKQAGVLKSSVFGSLARGEADEKSDIDILVEFPPGKSLFDLIELEEKLSSALKKKVDIGTYRSIKPFLKERILKEQVQIYEKQG